MAEKKDLPYMKKHLSDYINFQLSQGYEPKDVSDVLVKYGYNKGLIKEVMQKTDMSKIKKKTAHPHAKDIKSMDKELYSYLFDLLVNFIIKEKEQGYSINAIRKALLNYGHNPEIVTSAISHVEKGGAGVVGAGYSMIQGSASISKSGKPGHKHTDQPGKHAPGDKKHIHYKYHERSENRRRAGGFQRVLPPGLLYLFLVIAICMLAIFIGVSTDGNIALILLAFFPAILSLTVVYTAILQLRSVRSVNFMAIIGLALTVLVYVAMLQLASPVQEFAEHDIILLLNTLVSLVAGSILVTFAKLPKLGMNRTDAGEEPIPVEHMKEDSDEKLGDELEHGSDNLTGESEELQKIIDNGDKGKGYSGSGSDAGSDIEIKKLPERADTVKRISKRKLKIKPIN